MKKAAILVVLLIATIFISDAFSQQPQKDKGVFIDQKSEFWDVIKDSTDKFKKRSEQPQKKTFKLDFSAFNLPKSIGEFKTNWYNEPISQGNTGTCWCFSTTSFLESEAERINGKKLKISEMFTVYWEYVEKARRFVREHGNSYFAEGSEANAVTRIWKQYGCLPEESYTGLKPGQVFHDHSQMVKEMTDYLNSVKTNSNWNEEIILGTIRGILNYYLGEPPTTIIYNEKKMTPTEFLKNIVKINPDEYVDIMSLMEIPYWQKGVYDVPDNWWKNGDYYNVPLEDYMGAIIKAAKAGYTMCIGGDVSESGMDSHSKVAMIPSFDIPSNMIDENARQFRFSNNTTTDDHGIHLVGYEVKDGKYWFLIKDSGAGSRNVGDKGYYFFHEDFIKLKMLTMMVHRSAVEDLLKKFKG